MLCYVLERIAQSLKNGDSEVDFEPESLKPRDASQGPWRSRCRRQVQGGVLAGGGGEGLVGGDVWFVTIRDGVLRDGLAGDG